MEYFYKVSPSQIQNFEEKTAPLNENGCMLWIGKKDSKGYPCHTAKVEEKVRYISGHRFAYFLATGKPPEKILRHTCNVPTCVNPAHLVEGTSFDNSTDMVESGNSTKGSRNPSAKLTEQDVVQIRYHSRNIRIGELARKYKISESSIRSIRKGWTWSHVTNAPKPNQTNEVQ